MGFLSSIISKVVVSIISTVVKLFKQRKLEQAAARSIDLERHIVSTEEADAVEEDVESAMEEAGSSTGVETPTEKLKSINDWSK